MTIFGESSGGSSVAFHVTSKLSRGLFKGAIMESPGLTQSKTFEASETNTQFAVSLLTSAGSEGCSFGGGGGGRGFEEDGASLETKWRSLGGLYASGEVIGKSLQV